MMHLKPREEKKMDADKQHPATIQKDEVPHPPSPFSLYQFPFERVKCM
jgi:hypothetical protein